MFQKLDQETSSYKRWGHFEKKVSIAVLVFLVISLGFWGYLKIGDQDLLTAAYQKSQWTEGGFIKRLELKGIIYVSAPNYSITNIKTRPSIARTSTGEIVSSVIGESEKDCIFVRNGEEQDLYI